MPYSSMELMHKENGRCHQVSTNTIVFEMEQNELDKDSRTGDTGIRISLLLFEVFYTGGKEGSVL